MLTEKNQMIKFPKGYANYKFIREKNFTSMLACYYDISEKANFEMLFHDTYIFHHPTSTRNTYYILKFNFSGLTGKHGEVLEKEFAMVVFDSIKDFINQYHIDLNFSETQSAARMVSRFFVDIRPYLEDKKIISSLMNMIISQMNYYLLIFRSLHLSRIAMVMLEDFMKC